MFARGNAGIAGVNTAFMFLVSHIVSFLFLTLLVYGSIILLMSTITVEKWIIATVPPFQESHPFRKPACWRPLTMYGLCRISRHSNSVR